MPPHVHTNMGGWQRTAPRRATPAPARRRPSGASWRARPRAKRPGSPRRPAALAPRASRRREGGEVSARANRMFRLHGRRSPRDGRLAPTVRRHAGARARSECGRRLRRSHRRWPRGSCLAASAGEATCGAQSGAPGGRFPRRLLTGRAARPRHSARTRERRGVRANWPPLTRPTVRGLAVVCSSPHAAPGWRNWRAARASGTSRRRPSTTGHWAVASAFGAL
jgi:hypothetical protein